MAQAPVSTDYSPRVKYIHLSGWVDYKEEAENQNEGSKVA